MSKQKCQKNFCQNTFCQLFFVKTLFVKFCFVKKCLIKIFLLAYWPRRGQTHAFRRLRKQETTICKEETTEPVRQDPNLAVFKRVLGRRPSYWPRRGQILGYNATMNFRNNNMNFRNNNMNFRNNNMKTRSNSAYKKQFSLLDKTLT